MTDEEIRIEQIKGMRDMSKDEIREWQLRTFKDALEPDYFAPSALCLFSLLGGQYE